MTSFRGRFSADHNPTIDANPTRHGRGLPPTSDASQRIQLMDRLDNAGKNINQRGQQQPQRANEDSKYINRQMQIAFPKYGRAPAAMSESPAVQDFSERPHEFSASSTLPSHPQVVTDQQIMRYFEKTKQAQDHALAELQAMLSNITHMQTDLQQKLQAVSHVCQKIAEAQSNGSTREQMENSNLNLVEQVKSDVEAMVRELISVLWTKREAQEAEMKTTRAHRRIETKVKAARDEIRSARGEVDQLQRQLKDDAGEAAQQMYEYTSKVETFQTNLQKVKEEFDEARTTMASGQREVGRKKRKITVDNDIDILL